MSTIPESYLKFLELIWSNIPEPSESVLQVYQTAKDFFGEENVDLQENREPKSWEKLFFEGMGVESLCNKFNLSWEEKDSLDLYGDAITWLETESNRTQLAAIAARHLTTAQVPLYTIIVHFHNITVSNEHDESTLIEDIYAKVNVNHQGLLINRMWWLRTTVSWWHYISEYRHSHLPHVSLASPPEWMTPCLGTGPIVMTIDSLQTSVDLDLWPLFWLELDKCIRVESLDGGPYIRISQLGGAERVINTYKKFSQTAEGGGDFFEDLISGLVASKAIRFVWQSDQIRIANSFIEFTLLLSNQFLVRINQSPDTVNALQQCISRKIVMIARISYRGEIQELRGASITNTGFTVPNVFQFHNQPVDVTVLSPDESSPAPEHNFILLTPAIVTDIYQKLTILANYTFKYGK